MEIFFHSCFETQAYQVIPLLPLILGQEYGPGAWKWFYNTTKDFLGGYEYDLDAHKVMMKEEDINADVDKNWGPSFGDGCLVDLSDDEEEEATVHVIDIGKILLDSTKDCEQI